MSARSRNQTVSKMRYCVNCLARSHEYRSCMSRDRCKKCGQSHHTLLHPGIRSRLQQQERPKKRSSTKNLTSRPDTANNDHPANISVPNPHILSEAIRSLANVLCNQPNTSQGGGSV